MLSKKRGLTIHRNNHTEINLTLDDNDEVHFVGNLVYIVQGDNWQSHKDKRVTFSYYLREGEAFHELNFSEDEDLIAHIADMSKEDLEKIRNFCTVSGLIK